MEHKDPFILPSQYHGCWWLRDTRGQVISSHGIDCIVMKYSDLDAPSKYGNA